MNQITWSPQSLRDLESVRDFIALDSLRHSYAELVVSRLIASVGRRRDLSSLRGSLR